VPRVHGQREEAGIADQPVAQQQVDGRRAGDGAEMQRLHCRVVQPFGHRLVTPEGDDIGGVVVGVGVLHQLVAGHRPHHQVAAPGA
jgi:hypothetical protein